MTLFTPSFQARWALAFALLGGALAAQDLQALPEPKVLLERVIEATKALETARDAFTYMEESLERKLDGRGNPKETLSKTFEVTRVSGGQVRRLVAENGLPLSPEKAQAEDAAVQARLKTLLEPKSPLETGKKSEKEKGEKLTLSDMLAVLEVAKMERTSLEGRTLISLELRPRKGAKTSGLGQRLASKLAGRILVDEASSQVVLGEGRLLESCWVGGGLLGSASPPTAFKLEQAQVGDGVWMPVSLQLSLHARILVVPVHMEVSSRYWDFKRFQVEEAVVELNREPVKEPVKESVQPSASGQQIP